MLKRLGYFFSFLVIFHQVYPYILCMCVYDIIKKKLKKIARLQTKKHLCFTQSLEQDWHSLNRRKSWFVSLPSVTVHFYLWIHTGKWSAFLHLHTINTHSAQWWYGIRTFEHITVLCSLSSYLCVVSFPLTQWYTETQAKEVMTS